MKGDFLGVFGVIEDATGILFVQNRRVVGGREVLTWDLPGGGVEAGETLDEALVRELREELAIEVGGEPEFLFFQEGERTVGGARQYAWRSFFFAVTEFTGTPIASGEVLGARRLRRDELPVFLTAPYHDSFLEWVDGGGTRFTSAWSEP